MKSLADSKEILGMKRLIWILESWKNPGNLFPKEGMNPEHTDLQFLISRYTWYHSVCNAACTVFIDRNLSLQNQDSNHSLRYGTDAYIWN